MFGNKLGKQVVDISQKSSQQYFKIWKTANHGKAILFKPNPIWLLVDVKKMKNENTIKQ